MPETFKNFQRRVHCGQIDIEKELWRCQQELERERNKTRRFERVLKKVRLLIIVGMKYIHDDIPPDGKGDYHKGMDKLLEARRLAKKMTQ